MVPPDWEPAFLDYLYLAFTNASAFSPTDVMPMSRWAKVAMTVQSIISIVLTYIVSYFMVPVLGGDAPRQRAGDATDHEHRDSSRLHRHLPHPDRLATTFAQPVRAA